ncbi:MAG TPA: MgtC/SapB family protein [Acidobacteriota bacterium]|nr:MgtC/SapB family protein [Acidobacteriota bacterium]
MDFSKFLVAPDLEHVIQIGLAYILALPIGWDREESARGVGLRTFPLVAVASCAFVIIGQVALQGGDAQDKILAGLMTGIGFIGGGAILRNDNSVAGTSTAASIWITGAIGAAVAWHLYPIAVLLTALDFLTLRYFGGLKQNIGENAEEEHESK